MIAGNEKVLLSLTPRRISGQQAEEKMVIRIQVKKEREVRDFLIKWVRSKKCCPSLGRKEIRNAGDHS